MRCVMVSCLVLPCFCKYQCKADLQYGSRNNATWCPNRSYHGPSYSACSICSFRGSQMASLNIPVWRPYFADGCPQTLR
ncbi:hypothetical protein BJY52DRAFT_776616 [Lactarius psammicola]|nr:hypothetical protein BJY52DRAFT_776616 [Lactarius psammicola]